MSTPELNALPKSLSTSPLRDLALVNYLNNTLTDYEFEMLLRKRITSLFAAAHKSAPNLSTSHNGCHFIMSWGDEGTWQVELGETYSKNGEMKGQVLSQCVRDALAVYQMKHANKLSLLLPAPASPDLEVSPDPDIFADSDKIPF